MSLLVYLTHLGKALDNGTRSNTHAAQCCLLVQLFSAPCLLCGLCDTLQFVSLHQLRSCVQCNFFSNDVHCPVWAPLCPLYSLIYFVFALVCNSLVILKLPLTQKCHLYHLMFITTVYYQHFLLLALMICNDYRELALLQQCHHAPILVITVKSGYCLYPVLVPRANGM